MKRRGIRDNGQWIAEPFAFKAAFFLNQKLEYDTVCICSTNSTLILMYEEYANRHEASFLKVCPGG